MSNSLFDNDKNKPVLNADARDGEGVAAPVSAVNPVDPSQDTFGGYGAQNGYASSLSKEAWEKSESALPWNDSPQGRLAIRMFSRGALGAAFFTAGGMYARRSMGLKGYSPETVDWTKPLHVIAKIFDTAAGKPIKAAVHAATGDAALAERAVRFRPTAHAFSPNGTGRSLGEEAVGITFDFFCASVGDAWGRDIAGWFDPNVKKSWMDDKGNIKIPEALESAVKSTAKYVFYNGGEDWFAALPYAYFMKGQKNIINHFSPGFRYDSDRALNGGSFKIGVRSGVGNYQHAAAPKYGVIGNFQREGLLDLQSRFVAYNIFTRWFRAGWHQAEDLIAGKPTALFGPPDQPDMNKSLAGHAADIGKWLARGAIKAAIYMTPAVPFFWITHTPQSKYKGMFIDPKTDSVLTFDHNGQAGTVRANSLKYTLPKDRHFTGDTPTYLDKYVGMRGRTGWEKVADVANPMAGMKEFDPYAHTFGAIDNTLNSFGKANNEIRKKAQWLPSKAGYRMTPEHFRKYKSMSNRFVNASIAYTPYMYAKAEFANLWDDGKMDLSTERLIDGALHLNWGEFKAGANDIWHTILQQPLADPAREAEAQRRILIDEMPADVFDKTKGQMNQEHEKAALSWTERLFTGKKPEPVEKPMGVDGASLEDTYKIAHRHPADVMAERKPAVSHAEQEKMRDVLANAAPPTNAIN